MCIRDRGIRHTVFSCTCVDTRDPKRSEISFLLFSTALSIFHCFFHGVFSYGPNIFSSTEKTFSLLHYFFSASSRSYCIYWSWHNLNCFFWIQPVSYTHLDVYKRQIFLFTQVFLRVLGFLLLKRFSLELLWSQVIQVHFQKQEEKILFTSIPKILKISKLKFFSFGIMKQKENAVQTKVSCCLLYTSRCV